MNRDDLVPTLSDETIVEQHARLKAFVEKLSLTRGNARLVNKLLPSTKLLSSAIGFWEYDDNVSNSSV